jgi:hypothetical protein
MGDLQGRHNQDLAVNYLTSNTRRRGGGAGARITSVEGTLYSPSNTTGSGPWGQSFTTVSGGNVTSIKTSAIGGQPQGQQLYDGIAGSSMRIRQWVNDVETPMPGQDHALADGLAGENILETSTPQPTIIDYEYGLFPTVEFLFSGTTVLAAGQKYVMEFVPGSGVGVYVKIYFGSDPGALPATGQAYDINGSNLQFVRDFPFQVLTYN